MRTKDYLKVPRLGKSTCSVCVHGGGGAGQEREAGRSPCDGGG